MKKLTHLDDKGAARMVDVGAKPDTDRRAVARGLLRVSAETLALVRDGKTKKGDVIAAARIAGIMAAKKTSELIPLTHPLPLTHLAVDVEITEEGLAIQALAATTGPTGVGREAPTAAAAAGPTLHDLAQGGRRGPRRTAPAPGQT